MYINDKHKYFGEKYSKKTQNFKGSREEDKNEKKKRKQKKKTL